jgi:hypothetical protein
MQIISFFREESLFVSFVSYLTTVSEYYSEYTGWDGRISDKLVTIWNDAVVG